MSAVVRVTKFLMAREGMRGLDPEIIYVVGTSDGVLALTTSDLLDLLRRAHLVDSLDAEVDRLSGIIREQREVLDEYDIDWGQGGDPGRSECVRLAEEQRQ